MRNTKATLRANLTFRSTAFRHAIRLDCPPEGLPDLQETLHTLEHELKAEKQAHPEGDIDQHLIISQAKRMVHGIDAINQLLLSKWSNIKSG